jgi:hypothetical protein
MKAIPDSESQDNTNFRTSIPAFSSVSERGEVYMRVVFGDGDLDTFLSTMEEYWPDLKALIEMMCMGCIWLKFLSWGK